MIYTDDNAIDTVGRIRVNGPNGYEDIPPIVTGVNSSPDNQTSVYGIRPLDGGTFGPEDDGVYTVTLLPNTAADAAGNFAPEQVLGSFTLAIELPPPDVTPPTATLLTGQASVDEDGSVTFNLVYRDDREDISFGSNGSGVFVTGPDGFQRDAQGIAGGPTGDGGVFELLKLFPEPGQTLQPGEYFVSIRENSVFDSSGNSVPAGDLGSFRIV